MQTSTKKGKNKKEVSCAACLFQPCTNCSYRLSLLDLLEYALDTVRSLPLQPPCKK